MTAFPKMMFPSSLPHKRKVGSPPKTFGRRTQTLRIARVAITLGREDQAELTLAHRPAARRGRT